MIEWLYIKFLPVFATAGKYIKCLILVDGSKLLKIFSQTSHIGKWNYVEIVLSMVDTFFKKAPPRKFYI